MNHIRIDFCYPDANGVSGITFIAVEEFAARYEEHLTNAASNDKDYVSFITAVDEKIIVKTDNINAITITKVKGLEAN